MIVNQLMSVLESFSSWLFLEKNLNKLVIRKTIIANMNIARLQPTHAITSQPFGAKLGNIAGAKYTKIEVVNRNKPK